MMRGLIHSLFLIFLCFTLVIGDNTSQKNSVSDLFHKYPQLANIHNLVQNANLKEDACPPRVFDADLSNPLPTVLAAVLDNITAQFTSHFQSDNIPGMSAMITYKDKIIWKISLGLKNLSDPNSPIDENTIFRVGSVTKLFPTLMLYQSLKDKKIDSIDDTISKYNSNFFLKNPFNSGDITWRQVAAQLSGLPREAPCGTPCNLTTGQVLDKLHSWSLILPPWTNPSYSNLGFSLIGRLLEPIVGSTFENYVQSKIFQQLGMSNSGFQYTPDMAGKIAIGYSAGSPVSWYDMGWSAPCGQAYSSALDLAKLAIALNTNKLLPFDLQREMLLPLWVNRDFKSGFGTPWEIVLEEDYPIRNKGGNVPGYSALVSVVPELQLGLSVLWSTSASEIEWSTQIFNLLIPALRSYLLQQQKPIMPSTPSRFIGSYTVEGTGKVLAIIKEDFKENALLANVLGYPFYLTWVNDLTFQAYSSLVVNQELRLSCLDDEMLGLQYQYLTFVSDTSSGKVTGFSIPGFIPEVVFSRI